MTPVRSKLLHSKSESMMRIRMHTMRFSRMQSGGLKKCSPHSDQILRTLNTSTRTYMQVFKVHKLPSRLIGSCGSVLQQSVETGLRFDVWKPLRIVKHFKLPSRRDPRLVGLAGKMIRLLRSLVPD